MDPTLPQVDSSHTHSDDWLIIASKLSLKSRNNLVKFFSIFKTKVDMHNDEIYNVKNVLHNDYENTQM